MEIANQIEAIYPATQPASAAIQSLCVRQKPASLAAFLLFISFFFSSQSIAQDSLGTGVKQPLGFLTVLWTDSPETVKVKMLKLEGVRLSFEDSVVLQFKGGKFLNHDVKAWTFGFLGSRSIIHVSIAFKADSTNAPSILKDLEIQCERLYGASANHCSWIFEDQIARQSVSMCIRSYQPILAEIWYFIDKLPKIKPHPHRVLR